MSVAVMSEEDRAFWRSREPKCRLCGSKEVATFTRGGPLLDYDTDENGRSIFTGPHINTCPKVRQS